MNNQFQPPIRFGSATGLPAMLARLGLSAFLLAAFLPAVNLSGDDASNLGETPELIRRYEQQRIAAIEKATRSTVCVFVPGGAGGGSGVLISKDGFALTNFHVSSPAGTYMRCGLSDGNIYDAVIVGIDPVGDLALIRLLGRDDFPVAQFVDSRSVRVGDWCFAIGNPFLLATNLQPTVTAGIISGVQRYQYPSGTLLEYGNCFQTDASINPGNSGGPLYDAAGDLIGIIGRASFEKRGRVNVGVGYAISGNQAQNFLGSLYSGRIVDHATLGATVGTDDDGTVRVTNLLQSSDAYRRGLRYGDEILEIDGQIVETANDVQNLLATYPAQWRIPITFRQDGQLIETIVRLASVHRGDELIDKMKAALPPPPPAPPKTPEAPPAPDSPESEGPEDAPENDPAKKPADAKDAPAQPADRPKDAAGEPIPTEAAEQIVERRGFANYHFNRQWQSRFVDRLRKQFAAMSASQQPWKLSGRVDVAGEPAGQSKLFEMMLGDDETAITIGDRTQRLSSPDQYVGSVDSNSAAAVLAGMKALRRMIVVGPDRFGETYGWGTAPLMGRLPLREVTVGIHDGLESRFFQSGVGLIEADEDGGSEAGKLEVIESFADRDGDPAEIWFDPPTTRVAGEEAAASDSLPKVIQLRFGLEPLITLHVDDWSFAEKTN